MANSLLHGKVTSAVEVTNISSHGLWLFAGNSEFFISFDKLPWFKDVPVEKIPLWLFGFLD